MLVLGIESTCDETACAVVKDGRTIMSNVVASQIDLHAEYGGVVPELACRRHVDLIIPVLDQALKEASVSLSQIDLIAVAHGPGLIGALLIGLNTAKALSLARSIPFIGINHIEAHLYAAIMSRSEQVIFPCLGVVLSGGHTTLVLIKALGDYVMIGQTVDDAIGEGFDKVAKMLGLPYPGGPQIEKLALEGHPHKYPFKAGTVRGQPFNFSFSGLKTAVLYALQKIDNIDEQIKRDIAASFQYAAVKNVISKTLAAAEKYQVNSIVFGGGVTNNQYLRSQFYEATDLDLIWPAAALTLDNAAMIAGLGYQKFIQKGSGDPLTLDPLTRMPL